MIIRPLCIVALLLAIEATAATLDTTFTYQGALSFNGAPANSSFDFVFTLHDSADAGARVGDAVLIEDTLVTDGVFTVELDFGTGPFAGDQLWLEIGVREGTLSGAHEPLLPRQKLTAAPYALHAEMVAMDAIGSNEIAPDSLTGADIAAGAVGTSEIVASQVQRRVFDACASGAVLTGINEDGTVNCVASGSYSDADAVAAILSQDGAGSGLDADLLDGQQASEIVAASKDEVRIPISQADLPLAISTSGSYYFSENLSHRDPSTDAIRVDADHVTIDLGGFALVGPGKTSGSSNSGIELNNDANVTILNGTVSDFGGNGIAETGVNGRAHRVIDVRVVNNGGNGIRLRGSEHQVRGCAAQANGQTTSDSGIHADDGSLLINNTAANNAGTGIYGGIGAILINNIARNNAQWDIFGAAANLIESNAVTSGDWGGIFVNNDSRVVGNIADHNDQYNIYVALGDNVIERNHVTDAIDAAAAGNGYGIYFTFNDNLFRDNTATGNVVEFGGALPPAARNINNIAW